MRSIPETMRRTPAQPYDDAFGAVLLNPDRATPQGVSGPHGKAAIKRFNVYRNNVTHSLVTALSEIFPAVAMILGDENFRMIAREFLRVHPPRSRLVFEYGHGFGDFLAGFEPIRHLKYLPDVARLERAWLDAFHAADRTPLAPADLAALPPEALAEARFTPDPAMHLLRSDYAVHTIFTAHRTGPMPDRIDAGIAEAALVTRPALDVQVRGLNRGQFAFLYALANGAALQQAAGAALEADPGFDLSAAIALMLESGAFETCHAGDASQRKDESP